MAINKWHDCKTVNLKYTILILGARDQVYNSPPSWFSVYLRTLLEMHDESDLTLH